MPEETLTCTVKVGVDKRQHDVTMHTDVVESWHQIESTTPYSNDIYWDRQWSMCKE